VTQRRTDLVLLYCGGSSSSDRGVAYPVVLRNTGVGSFWDVGLRALHDDEETDRKELRRVGPQSESDQVFLLIPARCCVAGTPGAGLRPRGRATAEALVDGDVVAKVELPGGAERPQVERVPRTPEEEATLLEGRQVGWEYLLFGAVLLREMNALEAKYRDHEIGFAAPQAGPALGVDNVSVLSTAFAEVRALVANVGRVFDKAAQERAFGAPGEPGDAERIRHLASRIIAIYEGLLDWAARVRGTPTEDEFKGVADLAGRFADLPVEQFRQFVHHAVAELDRLPEHFASESDEPIEVSLTLQLDMDQTILQEYEAELRRLEMRYGIDQS
jgi:hypothetical protein